MNNRDHYWKGPCNTEKRGKRSMNYRDHSGKWPMKYWDILWNGPRNTETFCGNGPWSTETIWGTVYDILRAFGERVGEIQKQLGKRFHEIQKQKWKRFHKIQKQIGKMIHEIQKQKRAISLSKHRNDMESINCQRSHHLLEQYLFRSLYDTITPLYTCFSCKWLNAITVEILQISASIESKIWLNSVNVLQPNVTDLWSYHSNEYYMKPW